MFDWLAEKFADLVNAIPNLFIADEAPGFYLVRGMLGLIIVTLLVIVVALVQLARSRMRQRRIEHAKPSTDEVRRS